MQNAALHGPSVGWSPGLRAGENEIAATKRQLAAYPHTTVVRKFFSGSLGTWADGALSLLPPGCSVIVSIAAGHLTASLRKFAEAIPDHVPQLIWCGRHEPEKKTTPATFAAEFAYYDAQVPASHPLRKSGRFIMGPMMTYQRARIYAPGDWRKFVSDQVLRVSDFLGWNCYPADPADPPPDFARYEATDAYLKLIRQRSDEFDLPYGIGEFDIYRATTDKTGRGSADAYEDVYRAAVDDDALFIAQFSTQHGDLTDAAATPNRWVEYDRWRSIVREVSEVRTAYAAGLEVSAQAIVEAKREVIDTITSYAATVRP